MFKLGKMFSLWGCVIVYETSFKTFPYVTITSYFSCGYCSLTPVDYNLKGAKLSKQPLMSGLYLSVRVYYNVWKNAKIF